MDESQFDDITRALAATNSRRRVLRGVAASMAVAVGAAFGVRSAESKPKQDPCKIGCAGFGKKASKACEQACKECGGDIDRVCTEDGPFGPVRFTCCPTGTFCVFGAGVCCDEGTEPCFSPDGDATCCEPGTFCDFETGVCGPPVTCGPDDGCLGGVCGAGCFCVSSVEGDGACVNGGFADCNAQPCETSADCGDGGVCVDVSSDMCCGGAPSARVCFPAEGLCATDGTGTTRTSAPGWRR